MIGAHSIGFRQSQRKNKNIITHASLETQYARIFLILFLLILLHSFSLLILFFSNLLYRIVIFRVYTQWSAFMSSYKCDSLLDCFFFVLFCFSLHLLSPKIFIVSTTSRRLSVAVSTKCIIYEKTENENYCELNAQSGYAKENRKKNEKNEIRTFVYAILESISV